MRKLITVLLIPALAILCFSAQAQDKASPSPSSKLTQAVGTTEITIEYSRPSLKGRTIFPDMHKYGEWWRTGANYATKITFSKDVTVGGKKLAAGSYAILTKPGASTWEVAFFTYGESGWNTYTSKTPAASVKAEASTMDISVETFLIDVNELRDNSAVLGFAWGNTYVPVELGVK